MKKYNILVVPSDNQGGVGFYRSTQPHIKLEQMFPDEFSVTIRMNPDWNNLEFFDDFDLIHVHRGIYSDMTAFRKALSYMDSKKKVVILDVDDHWKLHSKHPSYLTYKKYNFGKTTTDNFQYADVVTTTTKIFADEIRKYNKNVVVLPNAIDPTDERFKINRKQSKKIRVGMIMGSSHEYDVKLMEGLTNKLPQEVKDKIQFVLCGFDLRGVMKTIDMKTGEVHERPLKPEETVWYRYEKQITDNYKLVSKDYEKFLKLFIPNMEWDGVENESYRRCWTKDMDNYYKHYENVDILLAPLEVHDFNKVKSQLKCIECCFSNTALIASDFGPYQLDLVNMVEKGGGINENGNALLVDVNKNHKLWVKYIKMLVENPELIDKLKKNIHDSLCEKFDLRNVTKTRAELYKTLIENKQK